jgi:hypothetical protein
MNAILTQFRSPESPVVSNFRRKTGGIGRWLPVFLATVQVASALTFGDFEYTDDGTSVTITAYPITGTGSVVVPDQIDGKPVTAIGYRAFFNCAGVVSVTLPASVTVLGAEAFYQCTGLTSMTVPSGVTAIPDNAFSGCISMATVNLPASVTAIGASSFYNCVALTSVTLPSGLTSLGANAFAECSQLSSVSLGSALATMGGFAFNKCISLTSITIPGTLLLVPTSAFEDCSALSSVTLSEGVKTLQGVAFRRCVALASIDIPASVTSIASDTFSRCTGLTAIQVNPGNASYSSAGGVLFNKTGSTLVVFPAGKSGAYAVPSGVTSIGNNAFRFAANLTGASIPSTVSTIGSDAFGSCPSLLSIDVDGSNTTFSSNGGVLFNKAGDTLRVYPTGRAGAYVVPSGVTTISSAAFRSSLGLTTVTLPASVTSIGNDGFATCSALTGATFQGSAPSLGARAFQFAAAGFTVYFSPGASGFTVPTWNGYPSQEIGSLTPVQSWLQSHNLPINSSLSSDSNGDGVSLLMAYALNLDPALNLSGSMPPVLISSGEMSMTFHAGAQGVNYAVQISSDLVSWTSTGVVLSPLDGNQNRTATCARVGPIQFMRLVVSN